MEYETAAICLSGDVLSSNVQDLKTLQKFCTRCGKKVIVACPSCDAPIQGLEKISAWVRTSTRYSLPLYCHNCGAAYPWTETAMLTAKALIDEEMQELSLDEKAKFKATLSDIVSKTPKTSLAIKRVSKFLKKVSPTAQETFKQIFYRFATDIAKAVIWTA